MRAFCCSHFEFEILKYSFLILLSPRMELKFASVRSGDVSVYESQPIFSSCKFSLKHSDRRVKPALVVCRFRSRKLENVLHIKDAV